VRRRYLATGMLALAGGLWADPPPGWVESPAPATRAERLCANYSPGWSVRVDEAGRVAVIPSTRRVHEISVSILGGRLEGADGGEWGGQLRWHPDNGAPPQRILTKNIRAILPIDGGRAALVLTGTAHMSFNSGFVYRAALHDDTVSVVRLASLGRAPNAVAAEREGTFLVLTTEGVLRISAAGEVTTVCSVDFQTLNAYSLAVASPDRLFVGMGRYVAEIHTTGSVCSVKWFVPAECKQAEVRDLACSCVGQQ
jgi:hypothetical protein